MGCCSCLLRVLPAGEMAWICQSHSLVGTALTSSFPSFPRSLSASLTPSIQTIKLKADNRPVGARRSWRLRRARLRKCSTAARSGEVSAWRSEILFSAFEASNQPARRVAMTSGEQRLCECRQCTISYSRVSEPQPGCGGLRSRLNGPSAHSGWQSLRRRGG
jgi:hypothetical protein